jgi:dihydrodipicolinate synthase/N-acetylneuraminate lyase
MIDPNVHKVLQHGVVIPASPLALTAQRKHDERRQRALWRYYIAAGAGGIAVGVHSTQFQIRDPKIGLFKPVLAMAADEFNRHKRDVPLVRIGGICGQTRQAVAEATLLRDLGYHAGLLSLAALQTSSTDELVAHCREVAAVLPLVGFYLQPKAGGRLLSYAFWRRFVEIENVAAIKMAPFNRYQTLDVVRAVAEAGRKDIALYTGNDDNIIADLLTPYRFGGVERRIVGGLLGHWCVWTKRAVELLNACHAVSEEHGDIPADLLRRNIEVTDSNAAFFDAANGFGGCIPGIHEVLRRQRLLEGLWTLDPEEKLGPGQKEEIDRVYRAYPHLNDDDFVAAHRDEWLKA